MQAKLEILREKEKEVIRERNLFAKKQATLKEI